MSNLWQLSVSLGSVLYQGVDSHRVTRRVKAARVHPDYLNFYGGSDIAVLTLDTPVTFSDYVKPVCLPAADEYLPLTARCYVTGFGYTQYERECGFLEVF